MLMGEPLWRQNVSDQKTAGICGASSQDDSLALPESIEQFGDLGFDVVKNDAGDQGSWNRSQATQWLYLPGPARLDGRSPGSSGVYPDLSALDVVNHGAIDIAAR